MNGAPPRERERGTVASAKRRFPAPSAASLGQPSFLMRKRPRVLRGTGYSTEAPAAHGLAGAARTGRTAQRASTKFLAEVPEAVRRRDQKHRITQEMEELQAAVSAEMREQHRLESLPASLSASLASSLHSSRAASASPSLVASRAASLRGSLAGSLSASPVPSSPAPERATPGAGGAPEEILAWERADPDGLPFGAMDDDSSLDSPLRGLPPPESPAGPGAEERGEAGGDPSWIETCRELDEIHGRVALPPLPLLFGAEGDAAAGGDAESEPPFDQVVCQIQNWVVRLDCVIDRLSARRALDQARVDMLERRALRRWARARGLWGAGEGGEPPPTLDDYNRWHLARLEERTGAPPLRGAPGPRTGRVPAWDHAVPRASDLLLRIGERAEGGEEREWCAGGELARRPALDLYSLVYALLPRGARYDINNFSALVCPTVNPKAACLVYASAKAQAGSTASARTVCTGAKTPDEVAWALHNLESAIWSAGSLPLRIDRSTFRVCNVVASVLLPFCVDMDKLARICQRYCTYTPEMFPAPVLRIPALGKVAILVYPHKLIIAGSKTKKILTRALRMAVRITWRARFVNAQSDGIRSMLKPHLRVLQELRNEVVLDRDTGAPMTPWGIAIASASSSFFSRRRRAASGN